MSEGWGRTHTRTDLTCQPASHSQGRPTGTERRRERKEGRDGGMRAQEGPSGFQQNVFFACQLFHVCSAFIIDLHQYLCQGKWLRLHHHLQQHLLSSLYTFGLYARIETGQRNAIFPSQRSSQDLIYFSFNGGGWLWNIETISGDVFIVTPLISLIFM